MSAPTFGDVAAIKRYVVDPDREYEFYEVVERPEFPADLRSRYYTATAAIYECTGPDDPRAPTLWTAIAKVEDEVRAWGKDHGYRLPKTGMRDDEGLL